MARQYNMRDICDYERITRRYCEIDHLDPINPNTAALIDLAYKEEEFNTEYVRFIIDKHLQNIIDYVYEIKGINVSDIPNLRQDIINNNVVEEKYLEWLEDNVEYSFGSYQADTIDKIIEHDYIQMLYFLYYSEEKKLTKLLVDGINEFNQRKFFIVR